MTAEGFRSGIVALIGRPNVGKSTLLNRLVGEKISIVSRRPQTTRHRILGIKTTNAGQVVYVDMPGMHAPQGRRLNQHLARLARTSVESVDAIVVIIAASGWRAEDDAALGLVRALKVPVVLAINKIDRLKDRRALLPLTRESVERWRFTEIVPISARTAENVDVLERVVLGLLPEQAPIYPIDWLTDKSDKFLARETIREQIFALYGQEIPHVTAVEVTRFRRGKGRLDIDAVIWAEREGQKAILIGKGGERLKQVGMRARRELEQRHGEKVGVRLWVKVSKGWPDDARAMRRLGYHDEPM